MDLGNLNLKGKVSGLISKFTGSSSDTQLEEKKQKALQQKRTTQKNFQNTAKKNTTNNNNLGNSQSISNSKNLIKKKNNKRQESKSEEENKSENIISTEEEELSNKDLIFFDDSSDSDISLGELPLDWDSNDGQLDKHIYLSEYQPSLSDDKYTGTLTSNKKKDGLGKIFNNAYEYIGEWEQDKKKGYGCYLTKTQEKKYYSYGRWEQDKLVAGYIYKQIELDKKFIPHLALMPNISKKIINMAYKGKIKNDERQGTGKLLITAKFKNYEFPIKINAKWKNNYVVNCYENSLRDLRNKTTDNYIKLIKTAFDDQAKIANIHFISNILEEYNILNTEDFIKILKQNKSKNNFLTQFYGRVKYMKIINDLIEFVNGFYKEKPEEKIDILGIIKRLIKEHATCHFKQINSLLLDAARNLHDGPEIIKNFVQEIFNTLKEKEHKKIYVMPSFIALYIKLINMLDEKSKKIPLNERNVFLIKHADFIFQHFTHYLQLLPLKQENKPIINSEWYIKCYESLYEQLVDYSIKLYNYHEDAKNYQAQMFHEEFLDTSFNPSDGVILSFNLNQIIYYYQLLFTICKKFNHTEAYIINPEWISEWLFNKKIGEIFSNREFLISSEKIDQQLWLYLSYIPTKYAAENHDYESIYILHEKYRKFIKEDKNDVAYERWRTYLNDILSYSELICSVTSPKIKETLRITVDSLSKLTDSTVFFSLLKQYLSFFKTYNDFNAENSQLFDLFEDDISEINNIILFYIDETQTYDMSLSLQTEYIIALNDLLTQLKSIDYRWYIDTAHLRSHGVKKNSNDINCINEKYEIYEPKNITNFKKEFCDKEPNKCEPHTHIILFIIKNLLSLIKQFSFLENNRDVFKGRILLLSIFTQLINLLKDQTENRSLEEFANEVISPIRHIIDHAETLPILKSKCELIDRYIMYERKLKQISLNDALSLFAQENNYDVEDERIKKLRQAYYAYENIYKKFKEKFIDGSIKQNEIVDSLKDIINVENSPGVLSIWPSDTRFNLVPKLLAHVAFILSILESSLEQSVTNSEYFIQPHCIQIIGILRLLAIDEDGSSIPNQLAQILTGQGKSWVLAMLAAIFAITGHQVTILCYSDNLTNRDERAMKRFYEVLRIKDNIEYKTLKDMSFDIIRFKSNNNLLYDIGTLLKEGLLNSDYKSNRYDELGLKIQDKNEKSVLLIDEVDVLFSDFYGNELRMGDLFLNENLSIAQKRIWEAVKHKGNRLEIEKNILSELDLGDQTLMASKLVQYHISQMISDAQGVYNKQYDKKFRFKNGEVEYKINEEGEYSKKIYLGYVNLFYYLQQCDLHRIEPEFSESKRFYSYLKLMLGSISYAELPKFPLIVGVSGSLNNLSKKEKEIVNEYQISKYSYFPSFWGSSRLNFDQNNENNYRVLETNEMWYEFITNQAKIKASNNQSVLIFFDKEETLQKFYNDYAKSSIALLYCLLADDTCLASSTSASFSREDIINQLSGQPGAVTLLTKKYGRGEDFKASAAVNAHGGCHVIQTFLSEDIKEEIQIKGRTCRKSSPGSYSLILSLPQINITIKKEKDKSLSLPISYKYLDELRNNFFEEKLTNKAKNIPLLKNKHDKTLELRNTIVTFFSRGGQSNEHRSEVLLQMYNLEVNTLI